MIKDPWKLPRSIWNRKKINHRLQGEPTTNSTKKTDKHSYLFNFCFHFLSQKKLFALFVKFLIKTNRAPFRIQPGIKSLKIQISKFRSLNSFSLTYRDTLKTFNKFWSFSPFFNLVIRTTVMHKYCLIQYIFWPSELYRKWLGILRHSK